MAKNHESTEPLLDDIDLGEKLSNPRHALSFRVNAVKIVALCVAVFLAGCFIGWEAAKLWNGADTLKGAVPRGKFVDAHKIFEADIYPHTVNIPNIMKSFQQEERFMKPPPSEGVAEPVWDSLLPLGLGYVRNPDIPATENISTISAMHQLHCLYTLRRIMYSSGLNDSKLESFDNGIDRFAHIGHCFEYLRNAIMCSADSSLEPFEVPDNGFPGMGFQRQCRDYEKLKEWAERWRVLEDKSFILVDAQEQIPESTSREK
jgi:hypothetical protein